MISLVTTCKNRQQYLEKTLPTWIPASRADEIIIVDYDSTIPVLDSLGFQFKNLTIIRCNNLGDFCLSHARNIGSRHVQSDYILFIDCDTYLFDLSIHNIKSAIEENVYLSASDCSEQKEIINGGLICARRTDHEKICGFNENMKGWGYEDIDYKIRLEKCGLRAKKLYSNWYSCIDHSDEERVKYYSLTKEASWNNNRNISSFGWCDNNYGKWNDMQIYKL